MSTEPSFSTDDEGKPVVDSEGAELGIVRDVRDGRAFVEPMADLAATKRAELGWGGDDRDRYRLDGDRVETVGRDEIRLSSP